MPTRRLATRALDDEVVARVVDQHEERVAREGTDARRRRGPPRASCASWSEIGDGELERDEADDVERRERIRSEELAHLGVLLDELARPLHVRARTFGDDVSAAHARALPLAARGQRLAHAPAPRAAPRRPSHVAHGDRGRRRRVGRQARDQRPRARQVVRDSRSRRSARPRSPTACTCPRAGQEVHRREVPAPRALGLAQDLVERVREERRDRARDRARSRSPRRGSSSGPRSLPTRVTRQPARDTFMSSAS